MWAAPDVGRHVLTDGDGLGVAFDSRSRLMRWNGRDFAPEHRITTSS
jgi:hypothetical protein